MTRYTRKRIGIWFAVLILLLSSTTVYASDCSDPTDCKNTIAGWVMIAVAIAVVVVLVAIFLPEFMSFLAASDVPFLAASEETTGVISSSATRAILEKLASLVEDTEGAIVLTSPNTTIPPILTMIGATVVTGAAAEAIDIIIHSQKGDDSFDKDTDTAETDEKTTPIQPTSDPVIDWLLEGATPEGISKPGMGKDKYRKPGNFDQANKEFDHLDELKGRNPIENQGNGIRTTKWPDGTRVSVRPTSNEGSPTIQITFPRDHPGNPIKVRYGPRI